MLLISLPTWAYERPRSRQDSNLRGKIPMDFESIALTTRPRLPRGAFLVIDPQFALYLWKWAQFKIVVRHLAERGFDPRTSGVWAQHASTAPLCCTGHKRLTRLQKERSHRHAHKRTHYNVSQLPKTEVRSREKMRSRPACTDRRDTNQCDMSTLQNILWLPLPCLRPGFSKEISCKMKPLS